MWRPESRIDIDFKAPQDNMPSIHDQVKTMIDFDKDHWTIKGFLESKGISYRRYYTYRSFWKTNKEFLENLVNIGVILSDDVLTNIYPKM